MALLIKREKNDKEWIQKNIKYDKLLVKKKGVFRTLLHANLQNPL